jgi:hypothetical protein
MGIVSIERDWAVNRFGIISHTQGSYSTVDTALLEIFTQQMNTAHVLFVKFCRGGEGPHRSWISQELKNLWRSRSVTRIIFPELNPEPHQNYAAQHCFGPLLQCITLQASVILILFDLNSFLQLVSQILRNKFLRKYTRTGNGSWVWLQLFPYL